MKIWNLLLISLTPFYLFAQNKLGPRLTAMGNNGAAVTDIWTLQANPSGITASDKPTVALNYIKHLFSNEISTQGLVAVIPFKNNFVGASFQRYGFTEYNESKIGFAYAKKFGDKLSIALNGNYHQLKITNYGSSTGFSIDVGALYHFDTEFTLGAFVSNPSKQKFSSTIVSAEIPTSFNVGASYLASDKVLIATTVSKTLNQSIDVRLGIDYKMFDLLSLRGGLSAKPFKQYASFGLNYKNFLMDMATTYDANLGYAPQIAVGYAF
ncbi:PorV/PorQ family protein [Pedobacter jamesrossensis]|uniref:Outer membrane protein beta-barrel domain-containing protein n=1 Tax=Pedobacter jamesrossensis TaxID=1908238 RepID=A0ABV8NJG1_9SPHI